MHNMAIVNKEIRNAQLYDERQGELFSHESHPSAHFLHVYIISYWWLGALSWWRWKERN